MKQKRSFLKSFQFAIRGLTQTFKDEPNFRLQIVIALFVVLFSYLFKISVIEWNIVLFIIFGVLVLELINTALEEVVNTVSPEIKETAKKAKDASAGAVLLFSLLAVIVGAIIFLPKILKAL